MIENYSLQVKYNEALVLFHNERGNLINVTANAGPAFIRNYSARGRAFDNDGPLDVLIGNNGGPPLLLNNRTGQNNHWLCLRLIATKSNRDAIDSHRTLPA